MSLNICVYCGASQAIPESYIKEAEKLGEIFAKKSCHMIYGGGATGLMGTVARSTLQHNGKVIGVISAGIMGAEGIVEGLTKTYIVDSLSQRKQKFFELADIFLVLPGGYGTLDEFFEVLTWRQINCHKKPIVIYNMFNFWDPLVSLLKHLKDTNFAHGFDGDVSSYYTIIDNIKDFEEFCKQQEQVNWK